MHPPTPPHICSGRPIIATSHEPHVHQFFLPMWKRWLQRSPCLAPARYISWAMTVRWEMNDSCHSPTAGATGGTTWFCCGPEKKEEKGRVWLIATHGGRQGTLGLMMWSCACRLAFSSLSHGMGHKAFSWAFVSLYAVRNFSKKLVDPAQSWLGSSSASALPPRKVQ